MGDKPSIIIAGGRTFNDYDFLRDTLDEILLEADLEVVSGGAKGVDSLGERYAGRKGAVF